ncbi:MAG: primosomal protein N' [Clostridia bacterium]
MIAEVIVDISTSEIDKIFDYEIPQTLDIVAGDRVGVPFGNQTIEGFCVNIKQTSECKTLKPIKSKLDSFTALSKEMLDLMYFMKQKYNIRYVDSLRLTIPSSLRGKQNKTLQKNFLELNQNFSVEQLIAKCSNRSAQQKLIVEALQNGGMLQAELSKQFSLSAINGLIDKEIVIKTSQTQQRTPYGSVVGEVKNVVLTDLQKQAVNYVFDSKKDTILLHGVTGSGKTEVYMHCIKRVLQQGKQAIMLVPEISLTPQILKNFRGRFGNRVAMLHSGMSVGERYDEWLRILKGEADVVVGARSAIFAPTSNLGIIVIDEEHDQSYVSDSNPRYNTIDVARFRANYNNAKVVIGSATPSIESYSLAKNNVYDLFTLNARINNKKMPNIKLVDMSQELRAGNVDVFSRDLKQAIMDTVLAGNQAIIFLNRRGYSSFVICKNCGYVAKCADCDVSLTYHSEDNQLKCHYCGKKYNMLDICPECGSKNIRYGKVGTEKVVKEIKKFLPDVKILRMDNDTTNTKMAYLEILGAFEQKQAQILVGTQMIAKGHDFPDVTLVGILDADMSLNFADYRSNERTFQLITQVSGRAGRNEKEGNVILQTYAKNHYVFRFAVNYDYIGFFEKEINTREVTKFPPFSKIIRILITSEQEDKAVENARLIYTQVKQLINTFGNEIIYMQAMKSPIKRLQSKFRYQILLRIKRECEQEIISNIYSIVENYKIKNAWSFVEINPQNLS